jgi:hypothetical protein
MSRLRAITLIQEEGMFLSKCYPFINSSGHMVAVIGFGGRTAVAKQRLLSASSIRHHIEKCGTNQ